MTKDELAVHIVLAALTAARVKMDTTGGDSVDMPMDVRLDTIVPWYTNTGRARFAYGLAHAAKGFSLQTVLKAGMTGGRTVTVGAIVEAVSLRLPARVYLCSDPDRHVYREWGSGKCRIDGTDLVELAF